MGMTFKCGVCHRLKVQQAGQLTPEEAKTAPFTCNWCGAVFQAVPSDDITIGVQPGALTERGFTDAEISEIENAERSGAVTPTTAAEPGENAGSVDNG